VRDLQQNVGLYAAAKRSGEIATGDPVIVR
jgi:hypothetical protein